MKIPEIIFIAVVIIAIFAASLFGDADAQIIPSIPYTLTNGSLADATQVMGNFNTIVTDTNANAATSGANTNITSLTGLTTPLSNTYGGTVIYTGGTTGGSANAQTLSPTVPSNFSLTAGNIVTGVAGFNNTTATTLSVNGGTAKQTAVPTGLGLISTPANSLRTNQGFVAYFDGTYFELLGSPVTNGSLPPMNANTVKVNATNASATPTDLALASNSVPGVAGANIVDITLASNQVLGLGSSGNLQGLTLSSNFNAGPGTLALTLLPLSSNLTADVNLNNTANFFDGPAMAQGTVGTWYVIGGVTLTDSSATSTMDVKLWDGTTACASGATGTPSTANATSTTITLACVVTSPAGNMRISAKDITSTSGVMKFNMSGSSKDSFITGFRIQ